MNLCEPAYAKLNLALDVGALRPDGYHEMRMLMQTCSLCDELRVTLTPDGSFPIISIENGMVRYDMSCPFNDERIISIKETKTLINKAKRAFYEKSDSAYKSLGKYLFKIFDGQDNRKPEYVKQ